jgi:hypothetical protein
MRSKHRLHVMIDAPLSRRTGYAKVRDSAQGPQGPTGHLRPRPVRQDPVVERRRSTVLLRPDRPPCDDRRHTSVVLHRCPPHAAIGGVGESCEKPRRHKGAVGADPPRPAAGESYGADRDRALISPGIAVLLARGLRLSGACRALDSRGRASPGISRRKQQMRCLP